MLLNSVVQEAHGLDVSHFFFLRGILKGLHRFKGAFFFNNYITWTHQLVCNTGHKLQPHPLMIWNWTWAKLNHIFSKFLVISISSRHTYACFVYGEICWQLNLMAQLIRPIAAAIDPRWHHQMAAHISRLFWLHFCTAGGVVRLFFSQWFEMTFAVLVH